MTLLTHNMLEQLPYACQGAQPEGQKHALIEFEVDMNESMQDDVNNRLVKDFGIEANRLDWRDERTLWVHDPKTPQELIDDQLKDVVIVIGFKDEGATGEVASRVLRMDLEGSISDFITHLEAYKGCVYIQ